MDFELIKIFLIFQDLKASGRILFLDQSPPPITFPALPTANLILEFLRKLSKIIFNYFFRYSF